MIICIQGFFSLQRCTAKFLPHTPTYIITYPLLHPTPPGHVDENPGLHLPGQVGHNPPGLGGAGDHDSRAHLGKSIESDQEALIADFDLKGKETPLISVQYLADQPVSDLLQNS